MASRLLSDDISRSNKLPLLSPEALNLFFLLIPHLSVHGKSIGDPYFVKGKICPKFKRLTPERIAKYLKEISDITNVKWFEIDGLWYIHSISYADHQPGLRKNRAGKDTLPDYPAPKTQAIDNIELRDNSGITPGVDGSSPPSEVGCLMLDVRSRMLDVRCLKEEEEVGIVEQIVLHLNSVLDTNYKSDNKKTRDLIKARQAQGFLLDDFKTVIDKKAAQWKSDSKMCAYLRPETLFGTKFESYLNERAGPAPLPYSDTTAHNIEVMQRWLENSEGGENGEQG